MPSILDFKNAFNGGTRENRFLVKGNFPGTPTNNSISQFHVTATQIPTLSTMVMEYNYFGRKLYLPGEKQYGSWSMRIVDDVGTGDMWKKFSDWQNLINSHELNDSATPNNYKKDGWEVQHLDLNGDLPLKKFILNGCWPKTIEPIVFNMANPNTLNQFYVVMIYDTIELVSGDNKITSSS